MAASLPVIQKLISTTGRGTLDSDFLMEGCLETEHGTLRPHLHCSLPMWNDRIIQNRKKYSRDVERMDCTIKYKWRQ